MKIRKVWFGLIVLLIVFTCLVLGYGVYESILKVDEYVRIYEKEVKVEDNTLISSDTASVDDVTVKVSSFEIYNRNDGEFIPYSASVDNEGNETVTIFSRELRIGLEFNKNEEILLEQDFNYILYDDNNDVLAAHIYGDYKERLKAEEAFYKEKHGFENYEDYVFNRRVHAVGAFFEVMAHEGKNDDPYCIEKIVSKDLEDNYELKDRYYLRVFNIRYRTEKSKEFIVHNDKIIEFVIDIE